MDIGTLRLLTEYNDFEFHGDLIPRGNPARVTQKLKDDEIYISRAMLPNGKRLRLLKTLISSFCEKNCHYCPFQAKRDFKRVAFSSDQFAAIFFELYRAGVVDGLFISSGIANNSISTQDRIIDTVRILREKYRYTGYIHLKIMPGVEKEQLLEAMKLANRLSINLEAPNQDRLSTLTPDKDYQRDLISQIIRIDQIRSQVDPRAHQLEYWPSITTQFVVGAAGDTDRELLTTTYTLYSQNHLKRVYFSPFSPVADTDLQYHPPTDRRRMVRLYQASYLLRDYGFSHEELEYDDQGDLPVSVDPKTLIARRTFSNTKAEINTASFDQLIRLPGIGHKTADKIISARRLNRFTDICQLQKLGIATQKIDEFILINGKAPHPQQLSFAF